jgi:signal transduction histidine kinase
MKGDTNNLRQILVNLLLNSIEAMSGPGTITISGKICKVVEGSKEPSGNVDTKTILLLSIKDHGVGVEPDEVQKIFRLFYTIKKKKQD